MIKKSISLIVTVSIFLFGVTVISAYAKNGPHIGPEFPENTDACAQCHRTHTAPGLFLLAEGLSVYDFCVSCHDGTGANTNVVDGRFEGTITDYGTQNDGTPGTGLNAGGFINAFKYTGRSERSSSWSGITSRHRMNGLDNELSFIAWGGGGSGPGTEMVLDCVSCHNPHGTENVNGSERYRILQNDINGDGIDTILASNESDGKDYTSVRHRLGLSFFCSECHTQHTDKASMYASGDGKGRVERIRHTVPTPVLNGDKRTGNNKPMNVNLNTHVQLPIAQKTYTSYVKGADNMSCLTCHQVHGTTSEVSESAKISPTKDSALLRLKNRGVCQDCHQR
ncbi:MAG: hypothetical protein E3J54_02660 [Actinobacteria bacterium]|nr:MAG: hypothetical protein E3J54_02660 [Actinomycetota bacterium]